MMHWGRLTIIDSVVGSVLVGPSMVAAISLLRPKNKGMNNKNSICQPRNTRSTATISCKAHDETWTKLLASPQPERASPPIRDDRSPISNSDTNNSDPRTIGSYTPQWTGECGPHCRPACLTLLLDLDRLDYARQLKCRSNQLCHCHFEPCNNGRGHCTGPDKDRLFRNYPKCYLEDATCIGPTAFDDTVAMMGQKAEELRISHCTTIPEGELYDRFRDWHLVTPIHTSCQDGDSCFHGDRKIYFEYCNVVEEDPSCLSCNHRRHCPRDCAKTVQPFRSGWTHFVVAASIPYPVGVNNRCDNLLRWEDQTATACFMQRVDLYYPETEMDYGTACPHCHECPLISLGDRLGALEVVGFGHSIKKPCESCDDPITKASITTGAKAASIDCEELQLCDPSFQCGTGEYFDFIGFTSNKCSFCQSDVSWVTTPGTPYPTDENTQDDADDLGDQNTNTQPWEQNKSDFDDQTPIPAKPSLDLEVSHNEDDRKSASNRHSISATQLAIPIAFAVISMLGMIYRGRRQRNLVSTGQSIDERKPYPDPQSDLMTISDNTILDEPSMDRHDNIIGNILDVVPEEAESRDDEDVDHNNEVAICSDSRVPTWIRKGQLVDKLDESSLVDFQGAMLMESETKEIETQLVAGKSRFDSLLG